VRLRAGVQSDLTALDGIAFAAKAHWGYTPEQLQTWQADLTVSAESLVARPIVVAEEDGLIVGFVQVATDMHPWELDALWVHPNYMGRGAGRALLQWAIEFAAQGGQAELAIDADPHAEGFYLACGARAIGSVRAPIAGNPDRVRPQLRLRTSVA
jgi:GNAT superfamily N-acetyltransferase